MAPKDVPHLGPHTPGAGARLLAEYLGRDLPEITDERRAELKAIGRDAMARARAAYGREPADPRTVG